MRLSGANINNDFLYFQLVYCFLVSAFGTKDGIFVVNVTAGLAWEIPQNLRELFLKEARQTIDSRHRRELYSKIRLLLDRQEMRILISFNYLQYRN